MALYSTRLAMIAAAAQKIHALPLAYFARPSTSGGISCLLAARRDKITAVSTVAGASDARRQWLWIQIVGHMTTARLTAGRTWIWWFGQSAIGATYERSQSHDGHA
jgi:hypothetical protein